MTSPLIAASAAEVRAPWWFSTLSRRVGLPAPTVSAVRRTKDISVPMPDGVQLLADLWQPVGVERAPLLLVRSPYGRATSTGFMFGRIFAHQGFQVLLQSCRGTAGSGGRFDRPFEAEEADGGATVEWMREQQWYPGSFATVGGSYLGYTQLALPAEARRDQVGAVLQIAPNSVRDIVWQDGGFTLNTALSWASQASGDPAAALSNLLGMRRLEKGIRTAGMSGPLGRSYREASKDAVPFFEAWLAHPDPDDQWWQSTDRTAGLDSFECPVLVQAGWYDTFLEPGIAQYEALRARGLPVELTIGPWSHLSFAKSLGQTTSEAAAFLREVTGIAPRTPSPAPVRLIEIGSGRQRELQDWAVSTDPWVLHLASDGSLADAPTPGAPTSSFRYDPQDPTPSVGGSTIDFAAGPHNNRELEARSDVLTFTSDALPASTSVLGSVSVDLWFGSDRPATAVFLRLCEVDGKGASTNVTDRMVWLAPEDRSDEGLWHVDVCLPATSVQFRAGSRVRLQVSSGAFPRYARHPGTAEPLATAVNYEPAMQTVHHSATRPATATLPVAPAIQ